MVPFSTTTPLGPPSILQDSIKMIKYEKYNFNCDQREIFGIDLLLFSELFLSLAIKKCITR